jgi:hypothetical protein
MTSSVPSAPYELQVSGANGASDIYSGSTDAQGDASGIFPVPNTDQVWNVVVTFESAGVTCDTSFVSQSV